MKYHYNGVYLRSKLWHDNCIVWYPLDTDHDGLTTMSWLKSVVAESNSVESCWYIAHSCRISQRSWGGNNVCCLHDRSFLLWSNMDYSGVILYEREYPSWRYDAWKYMLRWLRLEACCYFCCPNNLWHFVISRYIKFCYGSLDWRT